ncbi:MAG: helicase-related protein, partial [Acidobacteriaceae bacterium]
DLAPYFLRRDKDELTELPPFTSAVVPLPMMPKQRGAYLRAEEGVLQLPAGDTDITHKLAVLMRLRQIAVDPGILGMDAPSPKTEWIADFCADNPTAKVLVFTSFATYAHRLVDFLDEKGFTAIPYTGDENTSAREAALRHFRSSTQVLVMTYEAGGMGLNLQEANVVIHADLPWTNDLMEQALARAWRMGQTSSVQQYILRLERSVDSHLLAVLRRKEVIATKSTAVDWVFEQVRSGSNGKNI